MNYFIRHVLGGLLLCVGLGAGTAHADPDSAAAIVRPAGYTPQPGDVKLGEKLFNDTGLSTNGLSCASCHSRHQSYSPGFAKPYPHVVAMARDQLGRKQVFLDEMIQGCMVMPMAAKPLAWDSKELAALVAFEEQQQKSFRTNRKKGAQQ